MTAMASLTYATHWCFETMDAVRCAQGAAMERLGLGPQQTPFEEVLSLPGLNLRRYRENDGAVDDGRVALIIPAPIKRAYIWDLAPTYSAVRRMLDDGMRVYLIDWVRPDVDLAQAGLDQYGFEWIEQCVNHIAASCRGARPILLSHSLGGVLAAIYAALRPDRIAGLLLLETPLHFGEASGSFLPTLICAPHATVISRQLARVPGSFISVASANASPATFQYERLGDLLSSLPSAPALRRHLQVERWTLDEAPMTSRLFEQVVEELYRGDRLMHGSLMVAGQRIAPAQIHAPLLAVYDPGSVIIPPAAITAFLDATSSSEKCLLSHEGEQGVGLSHVGALIGPRAHAILWPRMLAWSRNLACVRH